MGKIKLKIAILFVLLLCLGAGYLYMNGMKIEDVPTAIGESLTNNDKDYTIYEYTITKLMVMSITVKPKWHENHF